MKPLLLGCVLAVLPSCAQTWYSHAHFLSEPTGSRVIALPENDALGRTPVTRLVETRSVRRPRDVPLAYLFSSQCKQLAVSTVIVKHWFATKEKALSDGALTRVFANLEGPCEGIRQHQEEHHGKCK